MHMLDDTLDEDLFAYDKATKIYRPKENNGGASSLLWPQRTDMWPRKLLLDMSNGTGAFTFERVEPVGKDDAEVVWKSTIGSGRKIVVRNELHGQPIKRWTDD